MPTTRPRHVITETDVVAQAIDDAAKQWPAEGGNRSRLLLRLVAEGHRALRREQEKATALRREAIVATGGALTGVYGRDYLENLRRDWPE